MKFVYNKPAVVSGDKLIIGDLHIGLESELSKSGLKVPDQTEEMKRRIGRMLFDNQCSETIILGDLKHSIPWAEWSEKEKLRRFVDELSEKTDLKIVKGNHDSSIEEYIDLEPQNPHGYRDGEEYFLHGHAEPREEAFECRRIYTSHIHPVIKITDSLGKTTSHKVWLKGKARKTDEETEVIVVPAFNELMSGVDIRKEFIGPMEKYIDTKELRVHLLNGTELGKVKDLRG